MYKDDQQIVNLSDYTADCQCRVISLLKGERIIGIKSQMNDNEQHINFEFIIAKEHGQN